MNGLAYLTIEQAAERGQFCRNTVKKAMRAGELRYMRFGRLVRIKVEDFDSWMEQQIEVTSTSQERSLVVSRKNQVVEKTAEVTR